MISTCVHGALRVAKLLQSTRMTSMLMKYYPEDGTLGAVFLIMTTHLVP